MSRKNLYCITSCITFIIAVALEAVSVQRMLYKSYTITFPNINIGVKIFRIIIIYYILYSITLLYYIGCSLRASTDSECYTGYTKYNISITFQKLTINTQNP